MAVSKRGKSSRSKARSTKSVAGAGKNAAVPAQNNLPSVLAQLQAVGLLLGVSAKTFAAAMAHWESTNERLQTERFLPYKAIELFRRSAASLILHAPMAAGELVKLLSRRPRSCPALTSSPPRVTVSDLEPTYKHLIRLEVDGAGTDYRCKNHSELVGVFNQALSQAGDERRFCLLKEEHEPSTYLLATPEQRSVLEHLGLVDDFSAPTLPSPFVPQVFAVARTTLGADERCHEAACVFRLGEASPEYAGVLEAFPREQPIHAAFPCEPGLAFVVCDGFGGQATGNVACEVALEGLVPGFRTLPPPDAPGRREWLSRLYSIASAHMREAAAAPTIAERPDAVAGRGRAVDMRPSFKWGGGGASIAIAILLGRSLLLAHAGNVRVTLRRARPVATAWAADDFQALTTDDSVGELRGPAPHSSASAVQPDIVTRAMGLDDGATVTEHELADGDVLMLASQGLYRALDAETIERILTREAPGHWNLLLMNEARARRAGNVTVLVAIVGADS